MAPRWESEAWHWRLRYYVYAKYYYRKGSYLFDDENGRTSPAKWAIWAYLVDGSQKRDVEDITDEDAMVPDKEYAAGDLEIPNFKKTVSSRRRYRRKQGRPARQNEDDTVQT